VSRDQPRADVRDVRVDVPREARKMSVPAALNDSFGFGGHNVALLFRKA